MSRDACELLLAFVTDEHAVLNEILRAGAMPAGRSGLIDNALWELSAPLDAMSVYRGGDTLSEGRHGWVSTSLDVVIAQGFVFYHGPPARLMRIDIVSGVYGVRVSDVLGDDVPHIHEREIILAPDTSYRMREEVDGLLVVQAMP